MQLQVLWPASFSTRTLTSQGIGFVETLKNPANVFKNNLNNTRNNIKSQIGGIAELLIPILNKIIRNQNTHFFVIMNNRLKIISAYTWYYPLKYGRIFSNKKLLMRGQKLFWAKSCRKVVLNCKTNDQIMPRFGRSFINDELIF